jgi:hypothetical protein
LDNDLLRESRSKRYSRRKFFRSDEFSGLGGDSSRQNLRTKFYLVVQAARSNETKGPQMNIASVASTVGTICNSNDPTALFHQYVAAKNRADATLRVEDGLAAGHAWHAFLIFEAA